MTAFSDFMGDDEYLKKKKNLQIASHLMKFNNLGYSAMFKEL